MQFNLISEMLGLELNLTLTPYQLKVFGNDGKGKKQTLGLW